MSLTNFPNGLQSFFVADNAVEKIAAYTVVTTTDSGKTFVSKTDGVVFTLPAIAIGNTITFTNTTNGTGNTTKNVNLTVNGGAVIGDVNGDGSVDLNDAVIALKAAAGADISGRIRSDYVTANVDVNGDQKAGLAEAVYALMQSAK